MNELHHSVSSEVEFSSPKGNPMLLFRFYSTSIFFLSFRSIRLFIPIYPPLSHISPLHLDIKVSLFDFWEDSVFEGLPKKGFHVFTRSDSSETHNLHNWGSMSSSSRVRIPLIMFCILGTISGVNRSFFQSSKARYAAIQ